MATAKTVKKSVQGSNDEIEIRTIEQGHMDFYICGTSPLICNRLSQKVWFELLAPKGKKTAYERSSTLKHDPIKEFRDSPYVLDESYKDTLLGVMASGFKKAMGTAALRIPGVTKAEIGQLVYVPGEFIQIFGLPKIFMAITRSADINKTPDVRTRAILPEWACRLSVTFAKPNLRETSIANLLAAAGLVSGIGDWRQEKGSGSYGAFRLCAHDDPDYLRIVKSQGRAAQRRALDNPVAYNDETSEILAWFDVEIKKRGFKTDGVVGGGVPVDSEAIAAQAPKRSHKSKTDQVTGGLLNGHGSHEGDDAH